MGAAIRTRVSFVMATLALAGPAHASDIAEALQLTREVLGEEAIEGYEAFVDDDPSEALELLLARDLAPDPGEGRLVPARRSRPAPFEQLGDVRLGAGSLGRTLAAAAQSTGIPVALLDAVIRTESGYRPRAVSRAGARGLMQLMPGTARALGVTDPFDPDQNVLAGARYLRRMYDMFGSVELALAAYNAGPGNVVEHGGIPPFRETRRYVQVVMDRYRASPLGR